MAMIAITTSSSIKVKARKWLLDPRHLQGISRAFKVEQRQIMVREHAIRNRSPEQARWGSAKWGIGRHAQNALWRDWLRNRKLD